MDEASASQYAERTGVANEPPSELFPAMQIVAHRILEPIRERFGSFSPTSWYRSPYVNRMIGGKPNSQHVKGEAVDVKIPGVPTRVLAEWCRDNIQYDQLILEYHDPAKPYSGWVHISAVAGDNRGQTLTILPGGAVKPGLFPPIEEVQNA
jgi:hypothetical protein